MATKIIKQVGNWQLVQDEQMGVTAIINEEKEYHSFWNTGTDAEEEMFAVLNMTDEEFTAYCANTIPLPF